MQQEIEKYPMTTGLPPLLRVASEQHPIQLMTATTQSFGKTDKQQFECRLSCFTIDRGDLYFMVVAYERHTGQRQVCVRQMKKCRGTGHSTQNSYVFKCKHSYRSSSRHASQGDDTSDGDVSCVAQTNQPAFYMAFDLQISQTSVQNNSRCPSI
ncbi:hypothetical protein WK91_20030 [Burkholderia cepacia]|nr:hypothetical protein WK91_20030 [Burkholderia cepacia]